MNNLCPPNGIESEWQEAQSRLRAYLRALHLAGEEQQEWIVSNILEQAAVKHAQNPGVTPTVHVMNEMRELSEQWFEKVIRSPGRAPVTGPVSLFAIDTKKKWPAAFLAEAVPIDFQRSLRECKVNGAPDLRVSRMVPQPFESALSDINLPTALGQLTKDLSPSLVAKVVTFVLSGFTIWSGNRLR